AKWPLGCRRHERASCAFRTRGKRSHGHPLRADRGRHVGRHHHRAFGPGLDGEYGPHVVASSPSVSSLDAVELSAPLHLHCAGARVRGRRFDGRQGAWFLVRAAGESLVARAEVHVPALREIAESSNAWPFQEARKIVARLKEHPKDQVVFETGYGPSGLPHIGTFGEVARTTMVRHAFRVLTDDKIKTRLIAFS